MTNIKYYSYEKGIYDIILIPPDRTSYLSKEYSFSSIEEINEYMERAKKETLETL